MRKFTVDDASMVLLIRVCLAADPLFGVLFVIWYGLLLRVQSEGILLHVGCDSDAVFLPEGSHASMWIPVKKGVAFFRLRSRTHRSRGSLLMRNLCR